MAVVRRIRAKKIMENHQKLLSPQEPQVQPPQHAIPHHPMQNQQPHIQQYASPQQQFAMHQMPMAPMPVQQIQAPLVHQQLPQMRIPPLNQPWEPAQQQLPSISSFPSISPVPPDSLKRKNESPVKKINFPAAKIKSIMKADDEVAMISSDAVLAMSAATELFLQELAESAWKHTARDSRKTVLYKDVAKAVESSIEFEFLTDVNEKY
jgi:histone H3/H4